MSHNLCSLLPEQQERVEVEKAAAYAVWKERNPEIKTPAESEAGNYKVRCKPTSSGRWSGTGR